MTLTLVWTFAIAVFMTGQGASCGYSSSRDWPDVATCERERHNFEVRAIYEQTPTRRISTLPCTEQVRRP